LLGWREVGSSKRRGGGAGSILLTGGTAGASSVQLTEAGIVAAIAQASGYLTSTTLATMFSPGGQLPYVQISPTGIAYSVLPGDVAAQVTALTTIVNAAANTSGRPLA
jgi:hypothetical protein